MDLEHWLPIPDFPGYSVSDRGRVYSVKRKPHRVLRAAVDGERRPLVALRQDGRLVTRRVHVLMLAAFVGPRPEGFVIRHLDGDVTNNVLSNLRYGTQAENARDSVTHGTHPMASKTGCTHGHAFTPDNTYICPRGKRECRTCRREASNRAYAKRRAA